MRRRLLLSYLTITLFTLCVLVYPLGRTFATREHDRLIYGPKGSRAAMLW